MPDNTQLDAAVFEIVVFKLREDATHEQLLEASGPVSDWVKQKPGFIERKLLRATEKNTYVEIVRWESLEQAHEAAGEAESSPQCAPMFALVDGADMTFLHATSDLEAHAEVTIA